MPIRSTPPVPSIASIASHYDSLDRFYRELWGEHVHHGLWLRGDETPEEAVVALSERVIDRLALGPGSQVADIGCGYGATARLLAERTGADVVGLTVSAAQKAYADGCIISRGSVSVRLQEWEKAEFADASLDGAYALESLEHVADKAGLAAKLRRAVKPGGRLVVATWLRSEHVSALSRRHLLDALCREGRQPELVTANSLCATLRQAGFSNLEYEDLTGRVKKTWDVIIGRASWRLLTRPDYRRFLFASKGPDRIFALTALRIWTAFQSGCFRYGFVTCD